MVSKITKKTPTKILTDRGSSRRKRSAIKAATSVSSIVVASIHTCHRRLIKIFSKLARIGTPPHKRSPKKHAYQLLPKTVVPRRSLFSAARLPPPASPEKPTIFLDLDETLVHSKPDPPPENYDFIVQPVIDGVKIFFYVQKRPFAEQFLESLSRKFEVVIFTAGLEEYASLVLDRLDRKSVISHRLYRDSCKEVEGKLVKDLGDLGRDLSRVAIVDDNPNSYALQPQNAIPILPFTGDLSDFELPRLMEFFEGCGEGFQDMREVVKKYIVEGSGDEKL